MTDDRLHKTPGYGFVSTAVNSLFLEYHVYLHREFRSYLHYKALDLPSIYRRCIPSSIVLIDKQPNMISLHLVFAFR